MSKVFRITPKTTKRVNNTVLTPEMEIIVTTEHHTQDPFYNGAKEIIAMYMDRYGFDYKRANATKAWFDYERLDYFFTTNSWTIFHLPRAKARKSISPTTVFGLLWG